ncbi:MAG: amylo-alpha-1,6-glucosidase [Burkholderiaceae bacterium]
MSEVLPAVENVAERDQAGPPMVPTIPVAQARSPQRLFVLKEGDTFLVADAYGDVTGEGDGLFHNDTRTLSTFRVFMNGQQPTLLSSAVSQDNAFFTANLTNHPLRPLGETSVPEGVVHVERRRFLWSGRLFERLTLFNYSDQNASITLRIQYGADFRDMFEVRGQTRARRGASDAGKINERSVELRYHGLDDILRHVAVSFSEPPLRIDAGAADFELSLDGRMGWRVYVEVGDVATIPDQTCYRNSAAHARRSLRIRRRRGARIKSSGRLYQAWLEKSQADLALLTTDLPTGPYPYAGIPWFSTPFGRDAVITAMQTLWLDPTLARGVLSFLAHHQAQETSAFRDAEPGKIMHETRKGEMAAINELPFGQYYGGVDTTPLFIMLAGAYAIRTGDLSFIDSIWPALISATAWIAENAALHSGFLSYARGEASGLANQDWKNSHDSVFHADGTTPEGPIALVEVQGYVYGAYRAMASLANARGDPTESAHWDHAATVLQSAVEARFWMEDQQFYALALDGQGRPCRVRASNAGHLLYSGLPALERGRAVARQLLSRAFDGGWGIRTLAVGMARFNPMSYHNGSVWPHDVALCAAGMARYGERDGAVHLMSSLFEAAAYFGLRLPELFCGFERDAGEAPVDYPVACLPQAWDAGSVFMMLQACLGVKLDAHNSTIVIAQPRLPTGIESMTVSGLKVGSEQFELVFRRLDGRVVAFVNRRGGDSQTRVELQL